MAKQLIDIGSVPNDGTGDPIRTAMDKVNDNFNEVYNALGPSGGTVLTDLINNDLEIELLSTANKISFLYDTISEMEAADPATHHGCIAHVHETGSLYYAHGEWRRLLSDASEGAITSYTDPLATVAYGGSLLDLGDVGADGTDGQVLTTDGAGNFAFEDPAGGGGGGAGEANQNAFSQFLVAGQDDVQADTTTDSVTLVAGSGITITTDASADSLTFSSTGGGTFSSLSDASTASITLDQIALQATTIHTVVAPDSLKYRFDHYGTTDNPTIHAQAGTTIAFDLAGVTASHPFLIRFENANYSTGLVHVAIDGTVSTGTNAQGKTSGTLYWKIPADISGSYGYLCSAHAAMIGVITVASAAGGGGGGGLVFRSPENVTTTTLNPDDYQSIDVNAHKGYAIVSIQTTSASWIRIYSDASSRASDILRTITTDPAPDSGVITEIITQGAETVKFTPAVIGFNMESPPTNIMPISVTNTGVTSVQISVTITTLQLEND